MVKVQSSTKADRFPDYYSLGKTVITLKQHTRSYYPKRYWELLPKEILGAITQRDTGSYYPKRYWELLPKEILRAITQRDTRMSYGKMEQMMKGSDIGIQEKKDKLFNEWERFTSTDGESIESYYHRFSKLMNDFKRNKHFPEKIASNLKFLNNLQPEWSRHVTIIHQTKDLHTADYDFLKYNQKEVDELRVE
ncbi:hypothetical protein Tco_0634990, partial [Tanacetum coccineum]